MVMNETYTSNQDALKTWKDVQTAFTKAIESTDTEQMAIFSNFYNFSIRNTMLAQYQAHAMGVEFTPFKTKNGWAKFLNKDYNDIWMKKGTHRIVICQPLFVDTLNEKGEKIGTELKGFKYPRNWILASTIKDMPEMKMTDLNRLFNFDNLLKNLGIENVDFDFGMVSPGCGGYSLSGQNKVAFNKYNKDLGETALVMFHEVAHAILHDKECKLDRATKELEAECTALLCGKLLDLDLNTCNDYLQHWKKNGGNLKQENYSRILKAFEKILKASKVEETEDAGE